MDAAQYNMQVHQGDTFDQAFTFSDEGGSALDLSGYTALMQWRDRATGLVKVGCDSAATPATMTITVDALTSTVTPLITAAQTALLAPGTYDYELQLTSPSGVVETPLNGTVTVTPDVTTPVTP